MKTTTESLRRLCWRVLVPMGVPILLLAACAGRAPEANAPPPMPVRSVLPLRQTFHAKVAAFGQLAADGRHALSLSLPQAGQVTGISVVAGQRVARGAPLLQLATDPSARSAYLQASAAVTLAREDLSRTRRLHAEKLATNTQLDAARKSLADAEAMLAARAQLGGASAVATLRAPADGVVTALDVQPGGRIAAGTRLLEFTPRVALVAALGVEPDAATGIHTGMRATLKAVFAARGAPPLAATVAMVGDAVNPATHLIDVVATLDQPVALPVGTALSGIILSTPFDAWAVPRDALQSDAHGSYIFQVDHGKAKRVPVTVLAPAGSPIGVSGAINPRDPVITLGSYEVQPGDPVRAVPAPATHPDHPAS